jgi:hypothetical protein
MVAVTLSRTSVATDKQSPRFTWDDVLDQVFPPMRITFSELYAQRLILRFSTPPTEFVIISRSNGVEARQYSIQSLQHAQDLMSKAGANGTAITAKQVADSLRTQERPLTVSFQQVQEWLGQLRSLQVPALPSDSICLDGCDKFDLWFDTRQDSVHFSMAYAEVTPRPNSQQQAIAAWMLRLKHELEQSARVSVTH